MSVDITTFGVVFDGRDNTVAFQAALDAGVSLTCNGEVLFTSVTWSKTETDLIGTGALGHYGATTAVPMLNIDTPNGFGRLEGLALNCVVSIHGSANMTPRDASSGFYYIPAVRQIRFNPSGQNFPNTTGLLFQDVTLSDPQTSGLSSMGSTAVIYGTFNGVIFDNLIGDWGQGNNNTSVQDQSGGLGGIGWGPIIMSGSDNQIRNIAHFEMGDAKNFVKFPSSGNIFSVLHSSARNKIFNNDITATNAREEIICRDCSTSTYVGLGTIANISGASFQIQWENIPQVNPTNIVGLILGILTGSGRGEYYVITGCTGTDVYSGVITVDRPLANVTAGDTVVVNEGFYDNEIYGNTLTCVGTRTCGVALWGSCFGNYVHDNTFNDVFPYDCGVEIIDTPPRVYANMQNRTENNLITNTNGGLQPFQISVYAYGTIDPEAGVQYGLQSTYPNYKSHFIGNRGGGLLDCRARVWIQNAQDMVYENNLLPVPQLATTNTLPNTFASYIQSDTYPPKVTRFTLPITASSLTVPITALTIADDVGVVGWIPTIDDVAAPLATDSRKLMGAPTSITFPSDGAHIARMYAVDAAGNVSAAAMTTVTITLTGDTTAPTITVFTMPSPASSLTVAVTTLTANDDTGVTGYIITESATVPLASDAGWSGTAPTSFTFAGDGTRTAKAYAKDAAGNVSAAVSATVTITLPSTGPAILNADGSAGGQILNLDGSAGGQIQDL